MAARADLTGSYLPSDSFPAWMVVTKAPAQNRVPHWTTVHIPEKNGTACPPVDLPHVLLVNATKGKATLPACTNCTPADKLPSIDHGMHMACGSAHLLGTPCPDGVRREPGPNDCPADPSCSITPEGRHVIEQVALPPVAGLRGVWSLGEDEVPADSAVVGSLAAEPEGDLVDSQTGEVEVCGRVDRLERPQVILDVIRQAMAGQQRNHQTEPGPSQLGGCERRLGMHLATGIGNGRSDDSAWRALVGTAVHAWLDEVFKAAGPRWLSSYRVTNPVAGTIDIADLFDRVAIDFKVSGATTLKKAARKDIAEKYQVQLDVYAAGLIAAGAAIERVALLFLPAAGSLSESVWYERDYNPQRAADAIARRDRVRAHVTRGGDLLNRPYEGDELREVLADLSTEDDYCSGCPAFGKFCDGAIVAAPAALRMVGA